MVSRTLAAFLDSAALAVGITGCADSETETAPGPPFQSMAQWRPISDDVSVVANNDGSFVITPRAATGYQTFYEVRLGGRTSLEVSYDVTASGGPGYIGVLNQDQSSWIGSYPLAANARTRERVTIPASGEFVQIVLQTSPETVAGATFLVHQAEYRLQ